ncbi:Orf [Escherichia coli]
MRLAYCTVQPVFSISNVTSGCG